MKSIIACVPVSASPYHPQEAKYSRYTEQDCPKCGDAIWVGERSQEMINRGTPYMCMACAVAASEGSEIITVTLHDPNAGNA